MKDGALPANPLAVDQVGFDNAEHRRAFYDAVIASGRDDATAYRVRVLEPERSRLCGVEDPRRRFQRHR